MNAESDYRLHIEHRLTRLETLLYILMALSTASVFGVRIFDAITFFHGGWP